jgi:outer membrane protein, multidrug efflux system
VGTALGLGAQASWAIDLWGGNRAGVEQARAQETAANAGWHAARVLVASELAQTYFAHRLCQVQLQVVERDRDSRAVTAEAAGHTERAGLTAPAVAAMARASLADSAARARQQADLCNRQVKALVALTALPEPTLRAELAKAKVLASSAVMEGLLAVQAVPMDAIRQRPDTAQAQANWVAAAQGVGVARAAMLPSLSFSGSWLRNRYSADGDNATFNTWSIGPISMTIPVVGRGALQARTDAAEALYQASGKAYAATLRQAVSEVEQALVTLDGLRQREADTSAALAGYTQSFKATEARYKVGFASLNELEEARRLLLNAESGAIALQQERINTWIGLYVALGGGFDPENNLSAIKDPS